MKTAVWIAVPAIALLTLASTSVSARAMLAPQEKSVGEKTKDGLSKTGEVMTDEWITGRIHARFVDEDLLKGSDISVDTSKHVVTLTGTVTGRAGKSRATTVARGTEGVNRVVNRLTIGPKI